ncbi:MAG: hypothetical protein MJ234_01265 [bacterium]|nr:hypothetical protein [bacterium]
MQISKEENFEGKEEDFKVSEIFRELKSKYESVEKADWFISSLEQTYRELRDKRDKPHKRDTVVDSLQACDVKNKFSYVIASVMGNVMGNVIDDNLLNGVRSSLERIYRKSRGKHRKECTAATLFDAIDDYVRHRGALLVPLFSLSHREKSASFLSSMTTYAALKPIVKALIKNDVSYLSELDFACKIYSDTLKEIDFACKFCSDILEKAEEAKEAKENDIIGFF